MHEVSVDQELIATAKARGTAEREMAVSAKQLFETLADGPSWTKWVFPVIRDVLWTSPQPFGAGTTRTVKLLGGITVDEVFWDWETNRRMGFAVTATSTGVMRALTEVYEITPTSPDRCALRWAFAVSFNGRLGVVESLVGRVLPVAQARLLKTLERVARDRTPPPS